MRQFSLWFVVLIQVLFIALPLHYHYYLSARQHFRAMPLSPGHAALPPPTLYMRVLNDARALHYRRSRPRRDMLRHAR